MHGLLFCQAIYNYFIYFLFSTAFYCNCSTFQNTTCNSKVKQKRRVVLARTPAFLLDLPKYEDEAIYEVNERNPNVLPDRESCEATERSGELHVYRAWGWSHLQSKWAKSECFAGSWELRSNGAIRGVARLLFYSPTTLQRISPRLNCSSPVVSLWKLRSFSFHCSFLTQYSPCLYP